MRVLLFIALAAVCQAQEGSTFAGTWAMRVEGQAVLVLRVEADLTGSMTKPQRIGINSDGEVTEMSGAPETVTIQKATLENGVLALRIKNNDFSMRLTGTDRATLTVEGMKPWPLERVPAGQTATIAAQLPQREYSPDIKTLRAQIAEMVKEDQAARLSFDDARIAAADEKDRAQVVAIFDKYGWVTKSLAGADASSNFWLLVQHQTLEIQQRVLPALEKAAKAGEASMTDYAYLYDRVQIGQNRPQHWGTQTKCENGTPVLFPVDEVATLDDRRRELFLQPVAEYLKTDYLQKVCREQK